MADFEVCYPFVLGNEDWTPPRYAVEPDPVPPRANPTNDAAIAADNAARAAAKVISGCNSYSHPADFTEIMAAGITQRPALVKNFYRQTYWNLWIAQLASNAIAAVTMDAEVNEGAGTGVKLLQEAIAGAAGTPVPVDGLWGPLTIGAANAVPSTRLLAAFQAARAAAYRKIGGPDLEAWLARAAKTPPFA